jgi:hypothetical protein
MDIKRAIDNKLDLLVAIHAEAQKSEAPHALHAMLNTEMNAMRQLYASIGEVMRSLGEVESSSAKNPLDISTGNTVAWDKDMNCYRIDVGNGLTLFGNVGNIFNKHQLQHHVLQQICDCDHQEDCNRLLNGVNCPYYHEPNMLAHLYRTGKITQETYETQKRYVRNFMNTSWIYSSAPVHKKKNVRFFGSSAELDSDIALLKTMSPPIRKKIVQTYKAQLCHDLLVFHVLHSRGAL